MRTTRLRFSIYEMDRIIVAILNNVTNIRFIKNILDLFTSFTQDSYNNDEVKTIRVYLITKLVKTILENNIQSKEVLLNTVSIDGRYAEEQINVLNALFDMPINDKESEVLDKKISELLQFAVIDVESDKLISTINNIKSENYDDLGLELDSVEEQLSALQKSLKDKRTAINETNNKVSFSGAGFLSKLNKVIEREKNPSATIRTGIKLFNEILAGGFKAGRVYCCMAPMKNFKSGLLLLSSIWAKKYNPTLKAKDPTKKPVILYVTLENSTDETIVRTVSYCMGNNYNIADHSLDDVARILKANGIYTENEDELNDVGLEMIYRPNKSVTVADIGLIMDDYNKEGKEVIFLVVDYIKRIKPSVTTKEKYSDLGNIADELHVLAIDKDIPILTAMQLNRAAIAELDAATSLEQKLAAFNRIGASNTGDSIEIAQNVDLAFTMVKTVNANANEQGEIESIDKFLNFRIIASRYNTGDVDGFIHRFKDGNDMCLEEDADCTVSKSIVNKKTLIQQNIKDNGIKTRGPRHV